MTLYVLFLVRTGPFCQLLGLPSARCCFPGQVTSPSGASTTPSASVRGEYLHVHGAAVGFAGGPAGEVLQKVLLFHRVLGSCKTNPSANRASRLCLNILSAGLALASGGGKRDSQCSNLFHWGGSRSSCAVTCWFWPTVATASLL